MLLNLDVIKEEFFDSTLTVDDEVFLLSLSLIL